METQTFPSNDAPLTDVVGLRTSGIFPKNKEPSVKTLRNWTNFRRIPYHRVGHFIYYDPTEVRAHIQTKLKVPARGYRRNVGSGEDSSRGSRPNRGRYRSAFSHWLPTAHPSSCRKPTLPTAG